MGYNASFFYLVNFHLFCYRPVDLQIWAFLTRSQCVDSLILRWPWGLVGLSFFKIRVQGLIWLIFQYRLLLKPLSGEDRIQDLLFNYALLNADIQTLHSKVCFPDVLVIVYLRFEGRMVTDCGFIAFLFFSQVIIDHWTKSFGLARIWWWLERM